MEKTQINILLDKQKRIIKDLFAKKGGHFFEDHTGILDEYFYSVFEKSITARKMTVYGFPFSMIALGGYGRKEQCIHSDIDLLILFEKKIPENADAFIQELIYPLWDAKFEVGYAVRTIDECIEMAFERFDILTTVLDARFICGASLIFTTFMERFRKELSSKHLKSTLNYLLEHGQKRLEDFGDSTYLLVPNIKSGYGGLRDYHTLLWYAKMKSDIKERRDLEYYGFLSHDEFLSMEESLSFIWKIRNRLHYTSNRKCDQLHFEYQDEVARLLGYKSKNKHLAVERFIGDLHSKMEFLKQINQITFENILNTVKATKTRIKQKPTKTSGIVIKKRRLYFENTVVVLQKPDLLIRIFYESGSLKLPISLEARRVVSEFLHLVDDDIIKDTACINSFKKILALSLWEFNVLKVMLSTGILGKFIPEFSLIVNKIQYTQYHIFPVDKHSIRCVQVLNSFRSRGANPMENLYYSVFKDIRNKNLLLMVALLHDIGKSDPAKEHSMQGAKIVKVILERQGYKQSEIEDAVFLVENHLFLVKTASRRDITDEETAVFAANKIGKIKLLRMLYLLSVADSMATGPKAWNEWTQSLLKDLFLKAMSTLKKGELATKRTERLIQKKRKEVLGLKEEDWSEEELNKELDTMSRRYLLYISAQDIIKHINLSRKMGDRNFILHVTKEEKSDLRTVAICGRDEPGFYSKIAGVFFMNNLDIVASQAYSWGKNTAFDIFNVKAPKDRLFEKEKWEKVREDLNSAITDDQFLNTLNKKTPKTFIPASGHAPKQNKVRIDNETSSFFTIIEVFTYDFPGLLFAITNALYRCGVDFRVAMIATKLDQVIDIFYVKNIEDDQKIESEDRLEKIKNAIIQSLPKIIEKEVTREKN